MIGRLLGLIPGGPWLLAGAALAGFLTGMWLGMRIESAAVYKAQAATAEVLQDIAEREAEAERAARIEAERRADTAARIAAGTAEQARNLTVEVRRLRDQHRDVTEIFRTEPVDPTCDCSLDERTRRRLLDIPATAPSRPAARPQHPAPAGGSDGAVP
jgi:hypothetical protein